MYHHSPSESTEYHTSQAENKAQVQQTSQIATENLQHQRYKARVAHVPVNGNFCLSFLCKQTNVTPSCKQYAGRAA